MSDITLKDIKSGFNLSKINDNFETIEDVINDEMMHLTGGNNVMSQELDMNSNAINNVPDAVISTQAINLRQLQDLIANPPADVDGLNLTVVESLPVTLVDGQLSVSFTEVDVNTAIINLSDGLSDRGELFKELDYKVINSSTIELTNSEPAGTIIKARSTKLTSVVIGDEFTSTTNYDTLALWQDDPSAKAGDVVTTAERSTGNGGGGTGDIISSGTETGFKIVKHNTLNLSFDLRTSEELNVTQWGAIKGEDSTLAIQATLDFASVLGRDVSGEDGVYLVSSITIPDFTTLKGGSSKVGWARLTLPEDYDFGFVIKCKDNSNTNPIIIEAGTKNWAIIDLTVDGNKANQTVYGQYCIELKNEASRNFGGLISGVKCVNPNGFGLFATGGPLTVTDCFFMSGAVFSACSDLKVDGCDFDGTDGLHPSLIMAECNEINMYNSFSYGWGEVSTEDTLLRTLITINTTNDNFTLADDSWMYENAPVLIGGSVLPVLDNPTAQGGDSRFVIRFAHDTGGSVWELYDRPFLRANSQKINFTTTGTSPSLSLGGEMTGIISDSDRIAMSGFRFAGSKTEGLRLVNVVDSDFAQIKLWGTNYRLLSGIGGLHLIDSSANSFSNSQLGATIQDVKRADHSVVLDNIDGVCELNIFDEGCRVLEALDVLVKDNTTQDYSRRNVFTVNPARDITATVDRIESTNHFLQPDNQIFVGDATSAQAITAASNLIIDWTEVKAKGTNIASGNTINFTSTKFGVYEIVGQIGIVGYDATLSQVDLTVFGLDTDIAPGGNVSKVLSKDNQIGSLPLVVDFSFKLYAADNGSNGFKTQILTTGGGAGMTVSTDTRYTRLVFRKISDSTF